MEPLTVSTDRKKPRNFKNAIIMMLVVTALLGGLWQRWKTKQEIVPSQNIPPTSEAPVARITPTPTTNTNNCFSAVTLRPIVDTTGWWEHTNHFSGFVLQRASTTQILREPEKESPGVEAFRLTSSLYKYVAYLHAVDLNQVTYGEIVPNGTSELSYNPVNNEWIRTPSSEWIRTPLHTPKTEKCIPNKAGDTVGQWPIYVLYMNDENGFEAKYIVVHPKQKNEDEKRFPIILDFLVIRGDPVKNLPVGRQKELGAFLAELETTIRSTRFFVPQ